MGRIPKGSDLAGYLNEFVLAKDIRSGILGVIGVVERVKLGFLDVGSGSYVITEIDSHREITSCGGNVSLGVDGRPAIHAHLTVSGPDGATAGGHLLDGTRVHYAEFWIAALEGRPFERAPDPKVGLAAGWVR